MASTFEIVKGCIAEQMSIDTETITLGTLMVEDLKADSIDFMAIIMELEQLLEVNFIDDDENLYALKTIGDIVEYVDNVKNQA